MIGVYALCVCVCFSARCRVARAGGSVMSAVETLRVASLKSRPALIFLVLQTPPCVSVPAVSGGKENGHQ